MPQKKVAAQAISASEYREMAKNAAKSAQPATTRPLPCHTEAVRKMRQEIAVFCAEWPKVSAAFSDHNPHYKVAAKYLHAEELFQAALCAWLNAYRPGVQAIHPKNEGKEGHVGQAKKRLMGVLEGVSDLLLQAPGLPAFYLELKRRPNRATPAQRAFLEAQAAMGNKASIAYDLGTALALVGEWQKGA